MEQKLEVLITAYEYMQKLYGGIQEAVECYRINDNAAGTNLTVQITEGLQWLTEALQGTLDIQKETVQIDEINDLLAEILEALENEDTVLLADLFEYELLEKLQEWYEKVCNSLEVLVPQE